METLNTLPDASPFPSEISLKIVKMIKSFSSISDIPVTYFNNEGEMKWESTPEKKICNFLDIYRIPKSVCKSDLMESANIAARIGEPYVFACCAGFIKIALSLIIRGEVVGCFMAGPIAVGKINENTISNIFRINSQSMQPEDFAKAIIILKNMRIFTPEDVVNLSNLLSSCVLSAVIQNEDYAKACSQCEEQSRSGEGLQSQNKESKSMLYHYKIEKELINNMFDSIYTGNSYVISRAVQLIRANYMNKISLEKIARSLYINPSYLSLHFKKEMGITFTDYLNDVRVKVSRDLLTTTHLNLLEISLHSGFEDQSYFTKVFKKAEGCTPKEYRKRMQKKNI